MAVNVLGAPSVVGGTRAGLFPSAKSLQFHQNLVKSSSLLLNRRPRHGAGIVRCSRLPLNPREAQEMAEGREPESRNAGSQGGGPNPFRFFQNFKDSLFQDHKRIEREKNLPKGDMLYTVEKGDTLYKISERHDTSLEVLMEANGIEDAHSLQEGQELWIPRTYQIKKGDTLYSISKKFGVTVEAIQRANGIQDADLIHEGDHIVLPEDSNAEGTGMGR